MAIYKSKSGALVAGLYLLLVAAAMFLPYLMQSAEAGMFVVSLTLPWSMLLTLLTNPLMGEAALKSEILGVALIAISALINAAIIYLLFALLTKTSSYRANKREILN